MAKQQTCQRYILKVCSSRLRKAKWKLTLPLSEARKNDELIALASSQTLRWMDKMNDVLDADEQAKAIKAEIRQVRREANSLQGRRKIKKLYEQLDGVQFKPDYLCVVMDKDKDLVRASKGFAINGVKYVRLLGTNGGVKEKTVVFISERLSRELKGRIDNGRNLEKEMVTAKLESYKALTCSASIPVSMPKGVLVVNDCETQFRKDIIYVNDECDGEPIMEDRFDELVDLNESDGYGLMLPSLADRWAEEINVKYRPSGVNTRFAWEKGMVFCFDFLEFSRSVAGKTIVRDAWGDERDIRDIELILTTSMVKLWDSYDNCEEYLRYSAENEYAFGITKVCPEVLESERSLNYQFIQSYNLSEEDIDELIAPTMDEINDILNADYQKTILFLKGSALNDENVHRLDDDYVKALMINPEMINDPFVQGKVFQLIKNRINEAKVGVIKVHGNYSIASGDPYALCQSIFGLEVTGILGSGEVFNGYWASGDTEKLACFRAPMTCHNNIRLMSVNRTELASYWYQHMGTCTIFNCWDTAAHALNGMDKDGDLVMLTDNGVLVRNLRELPALMCVQRKAEKRIATEGDFVQANIDSFGDDIGKTTNRITAMFEIQSKFPEDSPEYLALSYRIKCGQLFQQNAIDKAKGIIAKPMPREWYDKHQAYAIECPQRRGLYLSILADKKPYFMRYIYPNLMREYNTYIKNTNKKSQREFSLTISELIAKDEADLTEEEREFIKYYQAYMPVGTGDCVVNRICCKFEEAFDRYLGRRNTIVEFDYGIMKSGAEYSKAQSSAVSKLLDDYNRRVRDYIVFSKRERVDGDEAASKMLLMREEFRVMCDTTCSNAVTLCEILLDLCYKRNISKGFVWSVCGKEVIGNLLSKNHNELSYPVLDPDGDIYFGGERFSYRQTTIMED